MEDALNLLLNVFVGEPREEATWTIPVVLVDAFVIDAAVDAQKKIAPGFITW